MVEDAAVTLVSQFTTTSTTQNNKKTAATLKKNNKTTIITSPSILSTDQPVTCRHGVSEVVLKEVATSKIMQINIDHSRMSRVINHKSQGVRKQTTTTTKRHNKEMKIINNETRTTKSIDNGSLQIILLIRNVKIIIDVLMNSREMTTIIN